MGGLLALWIALSALPANSLAAPAPAPVHLPTGEASVSVGRQAQVLEDPGGRLTFAAIQAPPQPLAWAPAKGEQINLGYSRSAFWIKLMLRPHGAEAGQGWLALPYPLLDYLDVALVHADGRVEAYATGDRRRFVSRPVADRLFWFPVHLAAGEQAQLLLRVQGQGSLQVPLTLYGLEAREARNSQAQLMLGLYAGGLLAMLAYNLLLGASLRDRVYVHYVIYLSLFGAAQASLSGLAFQYLWPSHPDWGNLATPFFMSLTCCSLLMFSRAFLGSLSQAPRADAGLAALQWLFLADAVASLWLPYAWTIRVATIGTALTPLALLALTAWMLAHGVRQARFFLAAFGGLLLGVMLASLHMFGLLPSNFWTDYGVQIGSMLEITLLSFALADRFRLAREDNERLQVAHALELESKVRARTQELNHTLSRLTDAHTKLQTLSQHDALTGLKNRTFLNNRLPEIWRQAQRHRQLVSMLMIDIDHFKQLNDQHGHAAGDEALRHVAHVIAQHARRPDDHAVRYGGEEFLVILPQTHALGAAHIAEAIRLDVAALDVRFEQTRLTLTVSIGVVCVAPDITIGPDALIQAADRLLYQAKREGRNRCALQPGVFAHAPGPAGKPSAPISAAPSAAPIKQQPNPVSSE